MVVFTCNNCGESVKKPAVERHFIFKCRGVLKNISCMDCQKDFLGEDYVAHTRCITEAEKYSGKDYVAKEPKNSGLKKQESWMETIRSILDTEEYNLSRQTRGVFQKLQSVDNVPRKKAKFQNFVANCMRIGKPQAEEVWGVLEKELEKMKARMAPEAKPNGVTKAQLGSEIKTEVNCDQNAGESTEDQVVTMRVKKSKKRKVDKGVQNTIEQDEDTEILEMVTEMAGKDEPSKKKRKKKQHSESEQVNVEQEPTVSTTTDNEFQWDLTMLCTVQKYGNSVKLDKLRRKVLRIYLSKRETTALTEKQQAKFDKKFTKYLKKCNLKVVDNVVSAAPQEA